MLPDMRLAGGVDCGSVGDVGCGDAGWMVNLMRFAVFPIASKTGAALC